MSDKYYFKFLFTTIVKIQKYCYVYVAKYQEFLIKSQRFLYIPYKHSLGK